MSFVSPVFVGFLLVVLLGAWTLPGRRAQNAWLLVSSLASYGWVHPWFVALLLLSAALDYVAALGIERSPARARAWVLVSVTGNLALLAAFKYHGFFVDNLREVLAAVGVRAQLATLDVLMPIGISFYTFQTMGYTLEVARGHLTARRSFADVLLFTAFFPQLVAGPIERPQDLLPQLERERRPQARQIASGLSLALWGAVKKVCVADVVGLQVDRLFLLESPSFALVWVGVFGFGVQLYADFSGYTDIARGTARMLGIHLSPNFDRPFLAPSTPAFWRRWHMTLTSWIGRYVFEPLLALRARSGAWLAVSLMLTFALLGLWHGASWNFVVFGLTQGAWAVAYTFGAPLVPERLRTLPGANAFAVLFHLGFVLMPSALWFREPLVERAWRHLWLVPSLGTSEQAVVAVGSFGLFAAGALALTVGAGVGDRLGVRAARSRWGVVAEGAWWAVGLALLALSARDRALDFVYFSF